MIINDRVYGKHEITSSVLLALIKTKSLERLKGIAQFGVPDNYYHITNFSRHQHSIGVMLLLKILGASEEEQIAGLLHDASHTAFSHIMDWVVGEGKTENYQDQQHERFIKESEVPNILKKYGYDAQRITNYHHFGLLERVLPDLCADRVDYSLREFPRSIAQECIKALTASDNKIVFKNKDAAFLFATNFLKRQMEHWGGFEAASRYRIFANVLRIALKEGIITENDFWQTDLFIIKKLKASKHKEIHRILKILEKKSLSKLPKSNIVVRKKFRFVDPLFIDNGEFIRLSQVDKKFVQILQKARKENKRGVIIPLI